MLYAGNSVPRAGRFSTVDERTLFERLWRGALCRALGGSAPGPGPGPGRPPPGGLPQKLSHPQQAASVPPAPSRRATPAHCCCHCHCVQLLPPAHQPYDVNEAKTMRSVVRYGHCRG